MNICQKSSQLNENIIDKIMKTITCIRTPHGRVSGWRRRWYVRIGKITLKKKQTKKNENINFSFEYVSKALGIRYYSKNV